MDWIECRSQSIHRVISRTMDVLREKMPVLRFLAIARHSLYWSNKRIVEGVDVEVSKWTIVGRTIRWILSIEYRETRCGSRMIHRDSGISNPISFFRYSEFLRTSCESSVCLHNSESVGIDYASILRTSRKRSRHACDTLIATPSRLGLADWNIGMFSMRFRCTRNSEIVWLA